MTRSSPRILLVDDDAALRQALPDTVQLYFEDARIDVAESPQEALSLLSGTDYDVILTDFSMPKMDGLELIKNIRALHPHCPVILITAYHSLLADRPTGAFACLPKPLDRHCFIGALREAFGRRGLSVEGSSLVNRADCGQVASYQRSCAG